MEVVFRLFLGMTRRTGAHRQVDGRGKTDGGTAGDGMTGWDTTPDGEMDQSDTLGTSEERESVCEGQMGVGDERVRLGGVNELRKGRHICLLTSHFYEDSSTASIMCSRTGIHRL